MSEPRTPAASGVQSNQVDNGNPELKESENHEGNLIFLNKSFTHII